MREDDPSPASARFGELLAAQASRWSQRSLVELCGEAAGPFALDAALREHWTLHASGAWVDIEGWARALVRWLLARQQFLDVSEQAVAGLLRTALARAVAAPDAAVEELRQGLARLVRAQSGGQVVEVVCAEYSPALQLQVLGLTDVRGPLLDVGCGEQRRLVEEVRGRGTSAEGIDRAFGDDWLNYDYGVERWATVVSHHGFSLHFMHHHLRPGATALRYAQGYMNILRSLQSGGVFAYAPGLPFLEGMLPADAYRVVRVTLPGEVEAALQRLGLRGGHATQVWRR